MPYIENPDYVKAPDQPVTYDVLLNTTDGDRLVEDVPDEGGLLETAQAVARDQHHALSDAWLHGGRIWTEEEQAPIEMGPGDGGVVA